MITINIRFAQAHEAETIARLVVAMERELCPTKNIDESAFIKGAQSLLKSDTSQFWAMVAETENQEVVGVLTLNECAAIHSAGQFGEIMEIYILPSLRSEGIGRQLILAAKQFASEKGWSYLETGTPEQPKWQQTHDFYIREGFREMGARLKLPLVG